MNILKANAQLPLGLTYGEWTARWWQWAASIPDKNNVFKAGKAEVDLHMKQTGQVFFLPGTYNEENPASPVEAPERKVEISPGKFIMPTIIDYMASDLEFPSLQTEMDLRNAAALSMDTATDVIAELNGNEIEGLAQYRFQSPAFYFTVEADNALNLRPTQKPISSFILDKAAPIYRGVADGIYLIIGPIEAGDEVIIKWSAQAALWNNYTYSTSGFYEVTARK
jgi:hypothetical protein